MTSQITQLLLRYISIKKNIRLFYFKNGRQNVTTIIILERFFDVTIQILMVLIISLQVLTTLTSAVLQLIVRGVIAHTQTRTHIQTTHELMICCYITPRGFCLIMSLVQFGNTFLVCGRQYAAVTALV